MSRPEPHLQPEWDEVIAAILTLTACSPSQPGMSQSSIVGTFFEIRDELTKQRAERGQRHNESQRQTTPKPATQVADYDPFDPKSMSR